MRPSTRRAGVNPSATSTFHECGSRHARKRPRLVPGLVLAAVALTAFLPGCRGPSGGQATTASSHSAGSSTSGQSQPGQGPYRVTGTVPVGNSPSGVAVDPSTHTVYVTNSHDNTVTVIDGTTHTVTATVPSATARATRLFAGNPVPAVPLSPSARHDRAFAQVSQPRRPSKLVGFCS